MLVADVFRNAHLGDSTNQGITSRHTSVYVIGVQGPFDPPANAENVVEVHVKRLPGGSEHVYALPANRNPDKHYMFGGNFIWACDSRFRRLYPQPIPVHDRVE
jgi:hypothetical protein